MIMVDLFCDDGDCGEGVECVDVYYDQLQRGESIARYIPEGWKVVGPTENGYPIILCPKHSGGAVHA